MTKHFGTIVEQVQEDLDNLNGVERSDIQAVLNEVKRLQAKLKQLMDASRNIEPLLPCTVVGRVRLKNLYDIAEFRGLLLQMEDEHD